MDSLDNRRVKKALRAWRAELQDVEEHLQKESIFPAGEPEVIEPFEEIRVLRWINLGWQTMALVSWGDVPFLVTEDELERRTIRVFKWAR